MPFLLEWYFFWLFLLPVASCLLPVWTQRATEEQRGTEEQPIKVLRSTFYVVRITVR
jgi:hypothetical protein